MKAFVMKKITLSRSSLLGVVAVLGLSACGHSMEGHESSSLYQPVDVQIVGVDHAYCDVYDGSTIDKNRMRAPKTFTVLKSKDDLVINCMSGNMEVTKTIPAIVNKVPVWGGSPASGYKTKSHYYYPSPILFDFTVFKQPVAVPVAVTPVPDASQDHHSMTPEPMMEHADHQAHSDKPMAAKKHHAEHNNLTGLLEELGGKAPESEKVMTSDDDVVEIDSQDKPVSLAPSK